ncbi:unnamed protein product [Chrysoparadoxa australica]
MAEGASRSSEPQTLHVPGHGYVVTDLRPAPKEMNQRLLRNSGVFPRLLQHLDRTIMCLVAALENSAGVDGMDSLESISTLDEASLHQGDELQAQPKPGIKALGEVLVAQLQLMKSLSTNPENSALLTEGGLMPMLVRVVGILSSIQEESLGIAIEIMWNSLESSQEIMAAVTAVTSRSSLVRAARKANAAHALSTYEALCTLRTVLEAFFVEGYRAKDKELRNEVLIVVSFISRNSRSLPFFRTSGMVHLLLRYVTAVETGIQDAAPERTDMKATFSTGIPGDPPVTQLRPLADTHNFATTAEADLELKTLVWPLLGHLGSHDDSILAIVADSPLIETLLMYADLVVEEGPTTEFQSPNLGKSMSMASMSLPSANILGTAAPPSNEGSAPDGWDAEEQRLPDVPAAEGQGNGQTRGHANINDDLAIPEGPPGQLGGISRSGHSFDATTSQLFVPAILSRLPVTSFKVMQSQAIAALVALAPKATAKFHALGGHIVTMQYLERCGTESDQEHLIRGAVMLLTTVVGLPGLQDDLGEIGAVQTMLAKYSQTLGTDLKADVAAIISRLCVGSVANQTYFREADGIPLFVQTIKTYCEGRVRALHQERRHRASASGGSGEDAAAKFGSDSGSSRTSMGSAGSTFDTLNPLIAHVVDLLWNAVIGNRKSEARLLQCEGLDSLLDLLEVCPSIMRHQVTAVIADLLQNKRAVTYAHAWRSDCDMLTVGQLLTRLWIAEEARLGVSRPGGIVQNLASPLQKHEVPEVEAALDSSEGREEGLGDASTAGPDESALPPQDTRAGRGGALKQLSMALKASRGGGAEPNLRAVAALDLRGNISAVLEVVGFEQAMEGLSPSETMALLVAKHFSDFKEGEAWRSVRALLVAAQVKPIAADAALLEKYIGAADAVAREVQSFQLSCAEAHAAAKQEREKQFLASILFQRDQELRQALIKRNAAVPGAKKKATSLNPKGQDSTRARPAAVEAM